MLGYRILDTKGWSPLVNDAWILGAIHAGKPLKLVSEATGRNYVNFDPKTKSQFPYTVTVRELAQLKRAGYTRRDGWVVPPR